MKLTIKEMQYLAEKRDGKCLSKEYINALSKLQWKCKQGHIWWATPHSIKNQKTWCPYCADHILTIAELHQIAKIRGGKCLSDKYIDYNTKLKWQCKEGHVWEALPSSVKYRSWCPYCAGRNKTIEDMNKIAKSRGGKCLSIKYIHCESKLQWECDKGHTWWATYQSIRKHWCPHCAECAKSTIEEMQELAKSRGGNFLSEKYINSKIKLKWQCSEGHIWFAKPNHIKNRGAWCPICSSGLKERICRSYFEIMFKKEYHTESPSWLDNNWHIDGFCEKLNMAFEYNGIQHYKPICFGEYSTEKAKMNLKNQQIRDKEKLKLCNKNNVTLIVIPYTVKRKDIQHFIIQECKKRNIDIPNKKIVDYRKLKKVYLNDKLNEMKLLAESRNGKCLSKIYINQNTKLQWQCDKGHTWWAIPSSIKHVNRWCPHCAGCAKSTIKEMQELAKSRGGKCLSNTYVNNHTKLQWQCSKGHIWFAVPSSIKNGTWCPICSITISTEKQKSTIEDMQELAKNNDGECLSNEYINNGTKLQWQCKEGHTWWAIPNSIQQGTWCPYCAGRYQTIEDMQELAKSRGGKCLSDKYINNQTKLRWQCNGGHIWKSTPNSIKNGSWCPHCA